MFSNFCCLMLLIFYRVISIIFMNRVLSFSIYLNSDFLRLIINNYQLRILYCFIHSFHTFCLSTNIQQGRFICKKKYFCYDAGFKISIIQQDKINLFIIQMAQELIQLLRISHIEIKIGYQQDLYKIYRRYGPFSKQFFRELQVSSSSNFRQIVLNLANSLPKSQIQQLNEEIYNLINDFSNYLLQTRYLKVQDAKKLINDTLHGIQNQQIVTLYGLMEDYSRDFLYFVQHINNKTTNLQQVQKQKLINEINYKILDKIRVRVPQKILNLDQERVTSPQAFKVICLKNRIFIKESFLRDFLNFMQTQDPKSSNVQPLIKNLTYPFFYQKLTDIVSILFRKEKLEQNCEIDRTSIISMRITRIQPIQKPSFLQVPGQFPVSNLQIEIQEFESDGFSIPSRLHHQVRSLRIIQQPKGQSRRQSQSRLNPFRQQQNLIHQNHKDLNVILIYLTIVPCKNIQIKENSGKEVWTNIDFIQKNYKKTVQIYYINQTLKRYTQYTVRINERDIVIESSRLKIHKGCALIIETSDDPRFNNQRINLPQILNYSLFLGTKFLAKNVVYKQQEDIAIHFLKLFYDNYNFPVPQQDSATLLHNIYISKTVPFFHTKYLMYFFYEIFKKNALKYLFEHQIFKNLKYKEIYEFKPPKDITVLETAQHFYNLTQLITFMKMQPKQIQKIKNLAQKNLQNQKIQNSYIILYIIICEAPIEVVLLLQAQIKLKCLQNQFITQSEYYNLMTKFVTRILDNQRDLQQKRNCITKYLKDLCLFCERKKMFNSNRQLEIDSKIFDAFVNKSRSKNERINFSTLLKKLYKITDGELDPTIRLKDTGGFQPESEEARYLLCFAKKPLTNFDKLQIQRLIRTRLWSQHLQSFVNILASQCNLANYELQKITNIVKSILNKCSMITVQRVDEIVLGWLRVCKMSSQKSNYTHEDMLFLSKVFRTFLSAVEFMVSMNPPTIMIIRERKRIQVYLESAVFDSFKKEILLRLNRQLIQKQSSVEKIIQHIYRYNQQYRNTTYQRELKQLWGSITGRLDQ